LTEDRAEGTPPEIKKDHKTADFNTESWEALPIGAVSVDTVGRVKYANPAARSLLGSFLDDFIKFDGVPSQKVLQEDGSDFDPHLHPALRAFDSGKDVRNVIMGVADRETNLCKWLTVDAIPRFKEREVRPFMVSMFLRDISESKFAGDLINLHLQLGLSSNSTHGLEKSLDLILQHACGIPGFDCGGVYIVDQITGGLDLVAHRGAPLEFVERRSRLDFAAPQTRLVMKGDPIYSVYPEDNLAVFVIGTVCESLYSYLALIPFHYDERVMGALFLFSGSLSEVAANVKNTLGAIAARLAAVIARENAIQALKESENRHKDLLATMNEGFVITDDAFMLTYANDRFCEMLGYDLDEIIGLPVKYFLDEENRKILTKRMEKRKNVNMEPYELNWTREDGRQITTLISPRPILDREGSLQESFSVLTDITELKKTEETLRKREKELTVEKGNLEEVNTALKVLLQKREDDIGEVEHRFFLNVKKLVTPYVEKMKQTDLDDRQITFLKIIESNLEDVMSSFSRTLSAKYSNLTFQETQIANLVRQGMSTKEIADIFNLSERTVDVHRLNIRKKMGLIGKKVNLRSYLSQLK
jgi:PAS domain S-box-containing protein